MGEDVTSQLFDGFVPGQPECLVRFLALSEPSARRSKLGKKLAELSTREGLLGVVPITEFDSMFFQQGDRLAAGPSGSLADEFEHSGLLWVYELPNSMPVKWEDSTASVIFRSRAVGAVAVSVMFKRYRILQRPSQSDDSIQQSPL